MRRSAFVGSAVLLLACARSHDASSADAGEDPARPCRWSLGAAIEVARGAQFEELAGAVHATRDIALVVARSGTRRVGALVTTTERAELRATFEPSGSSVYSTESGFALSMYPDCTLELIDDDLAPAGMLDLAGGALGAECALSQTVAGRLEFALRDASGGPTTILSASRLGTAEQALEHLGFLATPGASALRVVHQPGWGTWVWVYTSGDYGMERLDAPAVAGYADPSGLSGSTADHQRGGIVVLARRDPPRGEPGPWQLERFGPDGHLRSPIVTPLPGIAPFESPSGTQDGAFIPLHDGLLAFVRWADSDVQIMRHDDSDRGWFAQVIVHSGSGRGGLLYRVPATASVLRWRPLVCER